MPTSVHLTFGDVDQFAAAIRAADTKIVTAGRGDTHVTLTQTDLHGLWMQRGEQACATTAYLATDPRRAILTFSYPGKAPVHWRGEEVPAGTLIGFGLGHEGYHYVDGPAEWGSMSLAREELAELGATLLGTELAAPTSSRLWTPKPAVMHRLLALHRLAAELARRNPGILAQSEPAQALKMVIVTALADCLADGAPKEELAARRRGSEIIAHFDAMLESAPDLPLYVPQVCAALGISQKTLQNYCHQHLGVSPDRYLRNRRMLMARRQLLRASPGQKTVAQIATDAGFFELGRFSVAYHELFGEPPKATLRRTPDGAPQLKPQHMFEITKSA
jgi:AraC-like DNA-binding protein